ncbi:MAG TPA: site-specific integrase [Thermoanaerobaculia bacterium]|nr:site-specific integrase [Thermoanaerobaculia bacterium]
MKPKRLPDGRWLIRYFEDGTKQGTYRQERLDARLTKAEADKAYKQRLHEAASRRGKGYARQTFGELASRYVKAHGPKLSESWRSALEGMLRLHISTRPRRRADGEIVTNTAGEVVLDPVFRDRLIENIRPVDVEEYRNERREAGAKNATVNREVAVLLSILNFGARNDLIERNPIPHGRISKLPEVAKDLYFTPEEWQAFSGAFDDAKKWEAFRAKTRGFGPVLMNPTKGTERRHGAGPKPEGETSHEYRERLRAAMDVFRAVLFTASRIGEVLTLTWNAIDLPRNIVRIYQHKTKRTKTLTISPDLRAVLDARPRGIGQTLVFQRPGGGPWDPSKLKGAFRLAKKISGVRPDLRIHDLRHTAASWMTLAGESERKVRDVLGHTDVRTTARYAHLAPNDLQGAVNVIGQMARANGSTR